MTNDETKRTTGRLTLGEVSSFDIRHWNIHSSFEFRHSSFPPMPLLLLLLVALASFAADTAAPAAPMHEVSPGVFEIGSIHLDKTARTVTFPGKVNLLDGNLEYLLVNSSGATHESLLTTEVQPSDLHLAMLLIGAKGAGITTPAPDDAAPSQINKDFLAHAPELKGDLILITVKWKVGNAEKKVAVEDWVLNSETKKTSPRGPWIYTGSMFRGDRFIAQAEGAFAAIVRYPGALINNPRKGSDNDTIWMPNKKVIPPLETPVEISITLTADPAP